MNTVPRFTIIRPDGVEVSKLPSPEAVLSRVQNLACQATGPGEWQVREYEDVLWTVIRGPDGTVRVAA